MTTHAIDDVQPKKKPESVQTWENEGGALPDSVFKTSEKGGFFARLPDRITDTRRRLGRIVLRNPELALGAALGLGVLIGTSSRRMPLLKLVLGAIATVKTKQLIESIASTTPADA